MRYTLLAAVMMLLSMAASLVANAQDGPPAKLMPTEEAQLVSIAGIPLRNGRIDSVPCGTETPLGFKYTLLDIGLQSGPVIQMSVGGPICYNGVTGWDQYLFVRDGRRFKKILAAPNVYPIQVLDNTTNGVHDILLGGPGIKHPVFRWNGEAYDFGEIITKQ